METFKPYILKFCPIFWSEIIFNIYFVFQARIRILKQKTKKQKIRPRRRVEKNSSNDCLFVHQRVGSFLYISISIFKPVETLLQHKNHANLHKGCWSLSFSMLLMSSVKSISMFVRPKWLNIGSHSVYLMKTLISVVRDGGFVYEMATFV